MGLDVGLTRLAALSDGRYLENPRPLERSLGKIRIIQKKLSKRKLLSGMVGDQEAARRGVRALEGF